MQLIDINHQGTMKEEWGTFLREERIHQEGSRRTGEDNEKLIIT